MSFANESDPKASVDIASDSKAIEIKFIGEPPTAGRANAKAHHHRLNHAVLTRP